MEFEVAFTDVTMNEGGGLYSEIKEIMRRQLISEGIRSADWTIRSTVIIQHETGMCRMTCEFKFGPKLRICDYASTSKDIFNDDTRCLRHWCIASGWGMPEVSEDAARDWIDYWKNQWETSMVDSEFLDKKFGERPNVDDIVESETDESDS